MVPRFLDRPWEMVPRIQRPSVWEVNRTSVCAVCERDVQIWQGLAALNRIEENELGGIPRPGENSAVDEDDEVLERKLGKYQKKQGERKEHKTVERMDSEKILKRNRRPKPLKDT